MRSLRDSESGIQKTHAAVDFSLRSLPIYQSSAIHTSRHRGMISWPDVQAKNTGSSIYPRLTRCSLPRISPHLHQNARLSKSAEPRLPDNNGLRSLQPQVSRGNLPREVMKRATPRPAHLDASRHLIVPQLHARIPRKAMAQHPHRKLEWHVNPRVDALMHRH